MKKTTTTTTNSNKQKNPTLFLTCCPNIHFVCTPPFNHSMCFSSHFQIIFVDLFRIRHEFIHQWVHIRRHHHNKINRHNWDRQVQCNIHRIHNGIQRHPVVLQPVQIIGLPIRHHIRYVFPVLSWQHSPLVTNWFLFLTKFLLLF